MDLLRKTWKQFLTSIGNRSENQLTVDVLEETNRAMHLGPISPVVVVGHANASGTFSGGDASGRMPVVEQNSSTIGTNTAQTYAYLDQMRRAQAPPSIGLGPMTGGTEATYMHHRKTVVPLTEAGGSIAATDLVAATAGYYGVVDRCWIWSPQTDAASTWTFGSTSGVTGINGVSLQLAANQTTEYVAGVPNVGGANCPLVVHGTADNETITLAAAALPAVGTTYYAVVEWHLET